MTQLGMVIDLERCYGCRACMEACKVENNTPRGAFWMHVFRYEEGEYPDVNQRFMPRPCQHCSEPACEKVCPTEARFKREEDGIVLTNYDQCIGCRYCEVACPYGVNYLQWRQHEKGQYGMVNPSGDDEHGSGTLADETGGAGPPWSNPDLDETYPPDDSNVAGGRQPVGTMGKCTFCVQRQEDAAKQGTTACQQTCPVEAIKFGDMEDPDSDPRTHLRRKGSSSTFELLEERGTEPNVVYIGDAPSHDAKPIEGADTFKDPEEAIEVERHPGSRQTEVEQ